MRRLCFLVVAIASLAAVARLIGFEPTMSFGSWAVGLAWIFGTAFAGWLGLECLGKAFP